jgi:sec-independent protein translocase protein TatB
MHVGDTIFIFCLALIIFGPKKLPEIGRQIGKLMVEFRRASNDFKMQIEEELRAAEQADRQKEIAAAAATPASAALAAAGTASDAIGEDSTPVISPPSTGLPVNYSFASDAAESTELPVDSACPDAYPEPPNRFNSALNTASNGVIAEEEPTRAASFPTEVFPPAEVRAEDPEPEAEKAQAPLHYG